MHTAPGIRLGRRDSAEGGLSAPMADHGTSERQGRIGPIIWSTAQRVPRLTMTRHLKAIYEGGVFRPLEPVEIAEHQEVSLLVEIPDEQPPDAEADMPIWEYAAQLMRDIPENQLKALPTDGASQHDHYLYGTPKRP
jgi:predicted DNA-binding antitoxin AbrB/MazE fold protein